MLRPKKLPSYKPKSKANGAHDTHSSPMRMEGMTLSLQGLVQTMAKLGEEKHLTNEKCPKSVLSAFTLEAESPKDGASKRA